MRLIDLKHFNSINIQCHDNPDADTIASGFALYLYFDSLGKDVRLFYSGRYGITKPNLTKMIELLNIPIVFTQDIEPRELLITVDSQYGAGNITKFPADIVAIIDHHQIEIDDIELSEIRPSLGSCSTLVWSMLLDDDFDPNKNLEVATALYYGLFTDTNNFAELSHSLDKDMRDELIFDQSIFKTLKNSNLQFKDIETSGMALLRCSYDEEYRFAIFKSNPCDSNILGFISDLALQVDNIETCIVYNITEYGVKYSVRSCTREVMANELAEFVAEGLGSGGGHREKAGGFINREHLEQAFPRMGVEKFMTNRMISYYNSYKKVYSDNHNLLEEDMVKHAKRPVTVGYIRTLDIFDAGTPIMIRTLEGDLNVVAADDIYIMIGMLGEVYPIKKQKFISSFDVIPESYNIEAEYIPTVRNQITGEKIVLKDIALKCTSKGKVNIYAKELSENTKVFNAWDQTAYMYGKIGDYIAMREDDHEDLYIVSKLVFDRLYEEV